MPKPSLLVRVVTRDLVNPEIVKRKRIDYLNASDRKWLASHSHWALNNGHSVTILPESFCA